MVRLREATSALHNKIDSDSRLADCLRSRSGLAFLLGRWYGFLRPFEERLTLAAQSLSALVAARKRSQYLITDLQFHGVSVDRLPTFNEVPHFENQVEMLGCMYVTEGSTLGGRFIARQIESLQGCANNVGYSFFNAYGDQTGSRWKEFGETVERVCADSPEVAVRSAVKTFTCVHQWLLAEM